MASQADLIAALLQHQNPNIMDPKGSLNDFNHYLSMMASTHDPQNNQFLNYAAQIPATGIDPRSQNVVYPPLKTGSSF